MEDEVKKAIEEYQCPGCVQGSDIGCFKDSDVGVGCGQHVPGTMMPLVGSFFLGMPKGFNRLGPDKNNRIRIFENFEQQQSKWKYDEWNVPVWKHVTKMNHLLIRGFMPRVNRSFLHIILNGDFSQIKCIEITQKEMSEMD